VLTVLRAITVIAAAIVTPQAAATLGLLVPADKRASSVAAIFVGWSLASVIAMPLANVVAKQLGWQWPFYLASLASAATAFWISKAIPKGLVVPTLTLHAWVSVFKHPVLIPVLWVTLLSFVAQFMLFSFLVPFLEKGFGFGPLAVPALLLIYGLFGVLGNSLAVKLLPRLGSNQFVTCGLLAIASSAVFLGLASITLGSPASVILVILALCVWGLAGFASNSAQQGRLMESAPQLASASIALNTSALYLGQGIGTPLGALIIATYGYAALPWACSAAVVLAIAASIRASRRARKYNS
jgi:MFS transporter, DHA1 family, inner membrane transport protein